MQPRPLMSLVMIQPLVHHLRSSSKVIQIVKFHALCLLLSPQCHLSSHHPLSLHHQQATRAPAVLPGARSLVALQTRDNAVIPTSRALWTSRSVMMIATLRHHWMIVFGFHYFLNLLFFRESLEPPPRVVTLTRRDGQLRVGLVGIIICASVNLPSYHLAPPMPLLCNKSLQLFLALSPPGGPSHWTLLV